MDRRTLFSACAAGFAFSANYTNHAPLVPVLRAEFGFDQARAGLLTTAIFLTHAIMQVPGGRLGDRFGAGRVVAVSLAWIAAANFAMAFAGAYWQLLFWKALVGIGSGACFAAAARYIVVRSSDRDRPIAQGIFGGFIVLGSGFVLFAVPQLLDAFGWRGACVACALVAAAAWLWWLTGAPHQKHVVRAAPGLLAVAEHGELWLLGVIQMASFGLMIVVGAWITVLLRSNFHLPLKSAGLMGSLVLLLGIASRPLGGWLAQRLRMRALLQIAMLLNALACSALAYAGSIGVTWAAIVVLGTGCGLPYAAIFNRAAALVPAGAGAAIGLVNMVGIVMILVGTPAVGALADWTGRFQISFWTLAAFSLVAAGLACAIPERA
ncbi:MAG TPA: MFS transporter [Bryobacteraceae bacterium]|nr:MFS transporter [Bryobacteraceae bacterium]